MKHFLRSDYHHLVLIWICNIERNCVHIGSTIEKQWTRHEQECDEDLIQGLDACGGWSHIECCVNSLNYIQAYRGKYHYQANSYYVCAWQILRPQGVEEDVGFTQVIEDLIQSDMSDHSRVWNTIAYDNFMGFTCSGNDLEQGKHATNIPNWLL